MYCNYQTRSIRTARCQRGKNRVKNIGTGVQELFFLVIGVFVELFTVMVRLSFLGCDVQQEGNWKSIICKYNITSVMVR